MVSVIFPRVKAVPAGTVLPPNYTVKGLTRDGSALGYLIPNNHGGRPYVKNIPSMEWELAYQELVTSRDFSRTWFNDNLLCAKDGGCSFKVIGEVFVLLDLADRKPARYVLRHLPLTPEIRPL